MTRSAGVRNLNRCALTKKTAPWIVLLLAAAAAPASAQTSAPAALPAVATNDNRQAAGTMRDGTLTLRLRASEGLWRPEGDAGPALRIQAFGEEGRPLQIPSPLLRVREGTPIVAEIRNELADPLRCSACAIAPPASAPPVDVPAGESRRITFTSGPAGTYHYWATTMGLPLIRAIGRGHAALGRVRRRSARRRGADRDRVFVDHRLDERRRATQLKQILEADDTGKAFMSSTPKFAFPINGRSWPHTERSATSSVNACAGGSSTSAPRCTRCTCTGSISKSRHRRRRARTRYATGTASSVVTQLMPAGATMGMTWTPERAGNWLFHCHVMAHVSPTLQSTARRRQPAAHDGTSRGRRHDRHGARHVRDDPRRDA